MAAQKKQVHAAERDTERVTTWRAAFVEAVQPRDVTRFPFGDETRTNLTYCRRDGRAPGGQRVNQAVPLHGGAHVPLLAALTPAGLGAAMTVSGAVTGAVFAAYLEPVLGPTLRPGEVVVVDHLPAHQVEGVASLVEAHGAHRLYRPPSSPDFTPIEWAFSKRNTRLREGQARSRQAREEALQAATAWSSRQDAQNWFAHGGYQVH